MLVAVIVLKGLVELILFVMIGQGILFVLAGASRHQNLVYRVFAMVTAPILKATRVVTPRLIVDQHLGLVAFFLLSVLWVVLVLAKVQLVLEQASRAV
jgi:hypothetical protein